MKWLSLLIGSSFAFASAAPAAAAPVQPQALAAPLRFEPNRGQTADAVRYLARGAGYGMFLTDAEAVLRFDAGAPMTDTSRPGASHSAAQSAAENAYAPPESAVLRMAFAGASAVRPEGRLPQTGRSHYLSLDGSGPNLPDVPHFSELVYRQPYPGIDVVYYGRDGLLEYDLVIAPGADPAPIRLSIEGAKRLSVAANGDLRIEVAGRTLVQRAPVAFQYASQDGARVDATLLRHGQGRRTPVSARYRLDADGLVRFDLGAYDRSRALVIDPILEFATYLGGGDHDFPRDIAVDSSGHVYVFGSTASTNFPTAGPVQANNGGGYDLFVTKLDPQGTAVVFSTYLGGSASQIAAALALSPTNEPVMAATTHQVDANGDAALIKLNAAGSAVVYSVRTGGSAIDNPTDLVVGAAGNALVVGTTNGGFPDVNPPMPGVQSNTFLWKVGPTGTTLFSGDVDCGAGRYAQALAVDSSGNLHLGLLGDGAVVWKLPASAASCTYNREVGGSNPNDAVLSLAVDSSGGVLATGRTASTDLPVVRPLQANAGGGGDAFLVHLTTTGVVDYATYLGGAENQEGNDLARDAANNVYIGGVNCSPDPCGTGNGGDAFVARFDRQPDGTYVVGYSQTLSYTTGRPESVQGLALDGAGNAYAAILLQEDFFPTTPGAFQASGDGDFDRQDALIVKISPANPTLTVASMSVNEDAGALSLAVALSQPSPGPVYVDYVTQNGSATSPADYTHRQGTLTISSGTRFGYVSVPIINDSLDELDETFAVMFSNPRGATLAQSSASVTILDDDAPPALSFDNGGCSVGEASGSCAFTARLSAPSTFDVTFVSATGDGTAANGSDYSGHGATARVIPAGQTTLAISVPVGNDTLDESNETFALNIANVANATPGSLTGTGTIVDDDEGGVFSLSQAAYGASESAGGVSITVLRSSGIASGVTVAYATANGSATAPGDYATTSGVLTFAASETSKTFSVPITNDTLDETDETFAISLGGATGGATLGNPASATATIVDDDVGGTLAFSQAAHTVSEAAGTVTITVNRSGGSASGVTVAYGVADGSATAPADYSSVSGTLSFAAGETSKAFAIAIANDSLDESDESFAIGLAGPTGGATLGTPSSGTVTIVDDDAPVNDAVFVAQTVPTSMIAGRSYPVTVRMRNTGSATWTAATEYRLGSSNPRDNTTWGLGRVYLPHSVPPGVEVDFNFTVTAPATPASYGFRWEMVQEFVAWFGQVTPNVVVAVAPAPGTVQFSTADFQVNENIGSAIITVTRTGGTAGGVTVDVGIAPGTAMLFSDYVSEPGTFTFAAGEVSKTFNILILDDALDENSETVLLSLSNPGGGASLGTPSSATLTILDNDPAPSLAFDGGGCSVPEGNTGNVNCNFVARLSAVSGRSITFSTATTGVSATAGVDFSGHTSTARSIPAGAMSATITVPVIGDMTFEADETFRLDSSTVVNATPASFSGTGTIRNDDSAGGPGALRLRSSEIITGERNGSVNFIVERTGGNNGAASVIFTTSDGSALAGSDYTAINTILNWASGDGQLQTVTVPITDGPSGEPDEHFLVTLSSATGATLGTPSQTRVLIRDNAYVLFANGFD